MVTEWLFLKSGILLWIAAVINISRHCIFFKYCIRLMDFKIFSGHRDNGTVLSIENKSLNFSISTGLI